MSGICIAGLGAVSPAGWGTMALRQAINHGTPLPIQEIPRAGDGEPLKVRRVPSPPARPSFLGHPRFRRTSPIAQYAVAAALEAMGAETARYANGKERLGIIYCSMAGCVNFSRRFFDETLKNPATASPLIFPETVFNAPASHLGAQLGTGAVNYTLVGDPGTFLQGLALGADWLLNNRVDACLVIGAEELDGLVAQAFELFDPLGNISEGAGALYLRRDTELPGLARLHAITASYPFYDKRGRAAAALKARQEARWSPTNALLCDGTQAIPRLDIEEQTAWRDWSGGRLSPKRNCGESFMAAAAWQCVAAVDTIAAGRYEMAQVSIVGCNQQAIAACFGKS